MSGLKVGGGVGCQGCFSKCTRLLHVAAFPLVSGGLPSLEGPACIPFISRAKQTVGWRLWDVGKVPTVLDPGVPALRMMAYCVCVCVCSVMSYSFVTPWTIACQAPLSMEFSSQEYWSGLPCPPLGNLPDPKTEPTSLASPVLAGRFFTTAPSGKPEGVLRGISNV